LDKQKVKEQANKVILGLGVLLMFSVMIPSVRELIGKGMDILMSPILLLVGDSNFFLILSAMAIITAIYSSLIQKYAVDQSKVFETQEKMKIFQKEMREAQRTQNTYMLKKLEEQQAEIMQENMAMMKTQFKPMLYIVFVSIPLFMWGYYYVGLHPDALMIFPFWGEKLLNDFVIDVWIFKFAYFLYWYLLSSFAFSQVIRKLLNVRAAGM